MTHFQTLKQKIQHFFRELPFDRKKQVLVGLLGVLVVGGLTTGVIAITKKYDLQKPEIAQTDKKNTKKDKKVKKEEPTTFERNIDGMLVDSKEKTNPVLACVMIENAAFDGVRPQSGLSKASVVYEVVVEGGITRFMAVFAGEESESVGPVRSARDTYLEFVSELNCAYNHAGGSYSAMQAIPQFKLRDVDGLREAKYFWRDDSKYAPHNLFTSTDKLLEAMQNHNWTNEKPPTYTSWKFVDAIKEESRPDPATEEGVQKVTIGFGGSYDVEYNYNAEKNVYERTNGGELQTDAVTKETLSTHNIIIQHVPEGLYIEGKGRVNWSVTGEGDVDIIHDGKVYSGTWKKPDRLSRTEFFDAAGKQIPLLRGNSWVEIVPPDTTVGIE